MVQEYVSKKMKELMEKSGIEQKLSATYTPQQNGKSERINGTLFNLVRCLLEESGLPKNFWAEALSFACMIRNVCPSKAVDGKIPVEIWQGKTLRKDELERFKVFGCKAMMTVLHGNKKLDSRAIPCVYLGIQPNANAYRLWNIKDRKIEVSREVVFDENVFPFKELRDKKKNVQADDSFVCNIFDEDKLVEENEEEDEMYFSGEDRNENEERDEDNVSESESEPEPEQVLRRSSRVPKHRKICKGACCMLANTERINDPKTVKEAMTSKHAGKWKIAMEEEMQNMLENNVFTLVKRPVDKNVIGIKWVFKVKENELGEVDRYKCRIVAKGFTQIPNVDYFDTYSPVLRKKTVRLLLALAVENEWTVIHCDVNSAYLKSEIKEEVYVEQPEWYEPKENGGREHVWKLNKSMYGLHQSGKDWNTHLNAKLLSLGFKRCVSEPCVYVIGGVIIGVYVDDLIVVGKVEDVEKWREIISREIDIKDMGEVKHILSMKVSREC